MALRSAMLATRPVQNITGIEMVVQQRYVAASSVKVPASTDQPVVRSKLSTSLRCHKRCSAHVSPDLESLARHDRHVIAACSAGNSQAIGIELTTSGTGPETDAQVLATRHRLLAFLATADWLICHCRLQLRSSSQYINPFTFP